MGTRFGSSGRAASTLTLEVISPVSTAPLLRAFSLAFEIAEPGHSDMPELQDNSLNLTPRKKVDIHRMSWSHRLLSYVLGCCVRSVEGKGEPAGTGPALSALCGRLTLWVPSTAELLPAACYVHASHRGENEAWKGMSSRYPKMPPCADLWMGFRPKSLYLCQRRPEGDVRCLAQFHSSPLFNSLFFTCVYV